MLRPFDGQLVCDYIREDHDEDAHKFSCPYILVPVYGGAAIRFHRWLRLQEGLTFPS